MVIITGDRYLNLLARFVEDKAGSLLDASLVLKLNPVGLHYVQTRLDALYELERLRTGAPVDYLRAYISDLGDHRALEQLSRILSLLPAVKIVSVLSSSCRDPCPLTLSPFLSLKSLELRGCDLSTSPARGLLQLRPILERFICQDSADALRHIFTERIQEVQKSQVWTRLTFVSCSNNGMVLMDDSLQLLPAVEFLDLSRNHFAKTANLHCCGKLRYLDLGFNQLRNISSLKQITSQITKLVLKNNALVNLHGIAALTSLEAIDLSNNLISKFKEIQSMATIPSLQTILLEGNPITACKFYREEVFSFFPDPTKVYLDGKKVSMSELWRVKKVISIRQKIKAVYGSYTPAEDRQHAYDIGNYDSRTKLSRLALIDGAQLHANEVEDSDSSGFPMSSNLSIDVKERKDKLLDENDQLKLDAIQFMQKAEILKMEKSIYWLQELRVLLDNSVLPSGQGHPSDDFQKEQSKLRDLDFKELRKVWSRSRKRQKQRSLKETLTNGPNNNEDVEREREHNKYLSNQEASFMLSEGLDEGESGTHTSVTNLKISKTSTAGSDNSTGILETSGVKNVDDIIDVTDNDQNGVNGSCEPWKLIYEVVESESQRTPGHLRASPPHYHEDVLQKHPDLEDELLQFSIDSGWASSSGESESNSDVSFITTSSSSISNDHEPWDYHNIWQYQPLSSSEVANDMVNHTVKESLETNEVAIRDVQASVSSSDCHRIPKEKAAEALQTNHLSTSYISENNAKSGGGQNQLTSEMIVAKSRQKKLSKVRTGKVNEYGGLEHRKIMKEAKIATTLLNDGVFDSGSNSEDPVEKFFNLKIANSDEGEICIGHIKCGCIRLWEESPQERDIHLLLSSTEKLYILMESHLRVAKLPKYSDHGFHVIASHQLKELKKVTVGLGLQALRLDIGHAASYLFVTRDIGKSREIFEMLRRLEGSSIFPDVESWEQEQHTLFEKLVLGSVKSNLLMYFLAFFCPKGSTEMSRVTRAVVLISHYIFICIEDLVKFGVSSVHLDTVQQPYFIVEAVADVYDLVQVWDSPNGGLFMKFKRNTSWLDNQSVKRDAELTVWRFTGLLDETVMKLTSLIHSIHPDGIELTHAESGTCMVY